MPLINNDGGGNCLFLAVSEGLKQQGKHKDHISLRVSTVTHMRKHAAIYSAYWDGERPDSTDTVMEPRDFEKYLSLLTKAGAWGGYLEIQALACITDRPIYVFCDDHSNPYLFNAESDKPPLALWYANRHYQTLSGTLPDGARQRAVPGVPRGNRGGVPSSTASRPLRPPSKGSLTMSRSPARPTKGSLFTSQRPTNQARGSTTTHHTVQTSPSHQVPPTTYH